MGIPPYTKIILIPGDERETRQYGISRAMVVTLIVLVAVMVGVVALLMMSFAGKHTERARIQELEFQLADARQDIMVAEELRVELDQMRAIQEKLLYMLGVEDASPVGADSLAAWLDEAPASSGEGMQRAAALSLSPKPDRWPAKGFVTREFISGSIPKGIKPHLGIDIAGPVDAPVMAAAPGVVERTGTDNFLGNYVEIRHGLGYLTVYGHLSRIAVGKNDHVEAGQVVAYMGESGQATGPHLHFEIWYQGEAVNPRTVVAGDPPRN
ncbi:MAG: M23 family metallopeptidase [Candidatus Krumholzibacteria bacterium]|nr:M23 family metallopeptidase [Candidatus Krumholzibacteria bacterium]